MINKFQQQQEVYFIYKSYPYNTQLGFGKIIDRSAFKNTYSIFDINNDWYNILEEQIFLTKAEALKELLK